MQKITFTHARDRRLVLLPDGSEGKLIYISPTSRVAKVLVGGKHLRIAAADLVIVPIKDAEVVVSAI